MASWRQLIRSTFWGVLGLCSLLAVGCSSSTNRINGQGATFVEPAITEWSKLFEAAHKIQIDYQGTGSGNGIQQFTKKTSDFGCSDAPMKKKELDAAVAANGEVIHIPLVIGAVVPAYNVEGVKEKLNFSGAVLAEIYLGKIRNWNDPKIQALNPSVKLPDQQIRPAYRSDSSGTTAIFTEYLSKVSPEFKSTIGASKNPKWPESVGRGAQKNDGVTGFIDQTAGALGYIELTYALRKNITYGKVQNAQGENILANLESMTAAAKAAMANKTKEEPYSLHEFTYSLTNTEGPGAYPIAGMSYAIIWNDMSSMGAKGPAIVKFMKWCVTEGQDHLAKLHYASLPQELREKLVAKLDAIKVAGQ